MTPRARRIDRLADLAPVLFAVPVILGLVVSFMRLLGTDVLDLGWATTVNSDAEQLWLGHTLYQDPSVGYTGQLYTPLFPAVVALLHHVHFWTGWPYAVTVLSTAGLLGVGGWLAYAPADQSRTTRIATGLGAAGMGALAYWAVGGLSANLIFDGRTDHFAWLLALSGLVVTARLRPGTSLPGVLVPALLLTLGLWAKQNTVAADLVAGAWVVLAAAVGWLALRQAATFVLGLAAFNLAALGLLNLLTGGWEYRLNFLWPVRHSTSALTVPWLKEAVRGDALALAILAAMAVAVLAGWLAAGRPGPLRAGATLRGRVAATLDALPVRGRAAVLLLAFCVVGTAAGVYFRRKQGGADNQFLGVVWGTGLLAAALWGLGRAMRVAAWTSAAMVLLGFVLIPVVRDTLVVHRLKVPELEQDLAAWTPLDPTIRALTRRGRVYDQVHSDLNVTTLHEIAPNLYNIVDLLAAGGQPKALAREFLDRHFDLVRPYDPNFDTYASGFGKWEEGWIWKINTIISDRYRPNATLPPAFLGRRPGAERNPWQRRCFGPFTAAGVPWRIGRGGGFWCQARPGGVLTQRGMPPTAGASQLRTQAPLRSSAGQLRLRVPRGGGASVKLTDVDARRPDLPPIWSVTLLRGAKARAVAVSVNGARPVAVLPDAGGRVTLRLGTGAEAQAERAGTAPATVAVPTPPADGTAYLTLEANQGTRLAVDLSGLRLALDGKGV